MDKINEIAEGFLKEAAHDSIALWMIAPRVRRSLGLSSNEDVKARTLDVVHILLDHGLVPGTYPQTGFNFWDERNAASIIARIDREWDPKKGDPNMADPICWFRVKRQ